MWFSMIGVTLAIVGICYYLRYLLSSPSEDDSPDVADEVEEMEPQAPSGGTPAETPFQQPRLPVTRVDFL